jgi:hypothetical protein
MTLDLSTDFVTAADGLESVTLRRRGQSPGGPGVVVSHALRKSITMREAAASGGRYTASDVVWHLPVAELPEAPRLGDVLRDSSGRRWTVLEVAHTVLGTRWRCASRNLAVVHALDDTITVLRAVYAKGDCGAAEAVWRPWKTGVRARIQPVAAEIAANHQARQTSTRFRIFVEDDLVLDHTHRIQGPDGTIYKVLATRAAERIGELCSIDAEVTPWP